MSTNYLVPSFHLGHISAWCLLLILRHTEVNENNLLLCMESKCKYEEKGGSCFSVNVRKKSCSIFSSSSHSCIVNLFCRSSRYTNNTIFESVHNTATQYTSSKSVVKIQHSRFFGVCFDQKYNTTNANLASPTFPTSPDVRRVVADQPTCLVCMS